MSLCSPWITRDYLVACGCPEDAPKGVVDSMITVGSEIMNGLTAHQWPGLCEETIYPCPSAGGYWTINADPIWTPLGESWPAVSTACLATNGCSCGGIPVVRFDRDRIEEVTEVMLGTDVLDPSAYRLDVDRRGYALTRIDGGTWPCVQRVAQPLPAETSWSVTYTYGQEPPEYIKNATASLVTEFIKGCVNDTSCRIPNRATTITTEGVTYALLDPQEFLDAGRTGLWEVDLAIRVANPGGVSRRSRIVSPESVDNRRIVPTGS